MRFAGVFAGIINTEKTLAFKWLDDEKTKAEIDITSTFDKKIVNGNILFLGSLCSAHDLSK